MKLHKETKRFILIELLIAVVFFLGRFVSSWYFVFLAMGAFALGYNPFKISEKKQGEK